jgi:adenine-specific DNA-methyltransferase
VGRNIKSSQSASISKTPKRKGQAIAAPGPDFIAERNEQLRRLFPEAFAEGRVDFDKLRAALGGGADERPERYSFTWAGKRQAICELQKPTWGTLVPCREESVNFDTTQNLFIEGENLEVLKLLYKSYFGRVKLIYIDPPYNTGNDFVYPDDFADPKDAYLRITGQKDAEGNLLTSNPETSGRFHSAWLSMMYPRLFLARQLLRDDGVIFVTIDDVEIHNLRLLMNEIFGEENFITQIEWQKRYTRSNNTDNFTSVIDHVLVYSRSIGFKPNLLERDEEANSRYANPDNDPRGPWKATPFLNQVPPAKRPNLCYEIVNPSTGQKTWPDKKAWRSSKDVLARLQKENRLWWGKDGKSPVPDIKTFLSEVRQGMTPTNFWDHAFAGHTDAANAEIKDLFGEKVFDTPKPSRLIRRMLEIGTSSDTEDTVFDFFGGSCSTAQAVLEQNRTDGGNRCFVIVQLPEPTPKTSAARTAGFKSIAEVSKERIRRVVAKMSKKTEGELPLKNEEMPEDLGFSVFKLTPSAFKPWPGADPSRPDEYARTMELFADPLVVGWKSEPVIHEVALREGFSLTARLEKLSGIKGNTVWRVTDADKGQSFRICLDDELKETAARALGLAIDELFICRDAALTDKLAANLALQCRLRTI